MRKFITVISALVLCLMSSLPAFANGLESEKIIEPTSLSVDGVLIYDKNQIDRPNTEGPSPSLLSASSSVVEPMGLPMGWGNAIGYPYRDSIPTYDLKLSYIYGTSISFVAGSVPTYTLSQTTSTTKSRTFSLGLEIEPKLPGGWEGKVSGGYSNTKTATITKGEIWAVNLTQPGTYNIAWYMRGHVFNLYSNWEYVTNYSTEIRERYLGTATFPTSEVHLDISRLY